jgi:hypothetical protein
MGELAHVICEKIKMGDKDGGLSQLLHGFAISRRISLRELGTVAHDQKLFHSNHSLLKRRCCMAAQCNFQKIRPVLSDSTYSMCVIKGHIESTPPTGERHQLRRVPLYQPDWHASPHYQSQPTYVLPYLLLTTTRQLHIGVLQKHLIGVRIDGGDEQSHQDNQPHHISAGQQALSFSLLSSPIESPQHLLTTIQEYALRVTCCLRHPAKRMRIHNNQRREKWNIKLAQGSICASTAPLSAHQYKQLQRQTEMETEVPQRKSPSVHTRLQRSTESREILHDAARDNERNICTEAKQRVELAGLINGCDLQRNKTNGHALICNLYDSGICEKIRNTLPSPIHIRTKTAIRLSLLMLD